MVIKVSKVNEEGLHEPVEAFTVSSRWVGNIVLQYWEWGDQVRPTCLSVYYKVSQPSPKGGSRPSADDMSEYMSLIQFLEDQKIHHVCRLVL